MSLHVRLARSPFPVGLLAAVCLSQAAHAAVVTITITGSVLSGTDHTGVFGFPLNTDLSGKPYTLTFTFDDTLGTGTTYTSYIKGSPISNPGTAALQIGDGPLSFAFGTSSNSQSSASLTAGTNGSYSVQAGEATLDSVWNNISGTISPATGTVLTTNPSWEAPFSDPNLYVSPSSSNNYSLSFGIDELFENKLTQYASGYLTATSISVIGPGGCPVSSSPPFGRPRLLPPGECQPEPNPACPVTPFIKPSPGMIEPGTLAPQGLAYMMAQFTVPTPSKLDTYATHCGFEGFDW